MLGSFPMDFPQVLKNDRWLNHWLSIKDLLFHRRKHHPLNARCPFSQTCKQNNSLWEMASGLRKCFEDFDENILIEKNPFQPKKAQMIRITVSNPTIRALKPIIPEKKLARILGKPVFNFFNSPVFCSRSYSMGLSSRNSHL